MSAHIICAHILAYTLTYINNAARNHNYPTHKPTTTYTAHEITLALGRLWQLTQPLNLRLRVFWTKSAWWLMERSGIERVPFTGILSGARIHICDNYMHDLRAPHMAHTNSGCGGHLWLCVRARICARQTVFVHAYVRSS